MRVPPHPRATESNSTSAKFVPLLTNPKNLGMMSLDTQPYPPGRGMAVRATQLCQIGWLFCTAVLFPSAAQPTSYLADKEDWNR